MFGRIDDRSARLARAVFMFHYVQTIDLYTSMCIRRFWTVAVCSLETWSTQAASIPCYSVLPNETRRGVLRMLACYFDPRSSRHPIPISRWAVANVVWKMWCETVDLFISTEEDWTIQNCAIIFVNVSMVSYIILCGCGPVAKWSMTMVVVFSLVCFFIWR